MVGTFIRDVLCSEFDCPDVSSPLNLSILRYNVRSRNILWENTHHTNNGQNSPINRAQRLFNELSVHFDFSLGRNKVRLGAKAN
jgi:hypothetical protein